MPKLFSGLDIIKFLEKKGFSIYSRKSSHVKMISVQRNTKTIIPINDELPTGTLRSIIRQTQLTSEEMAELFDR